MSAQDLIVKRTQEGIDGIFKAVKAMPEDKLDWQPMDAGRSAMDQLKEVTRASVWFSLMAEAKAEPEWGDDQSAKVKAMAESWNSLDDVEKALRDHTDKLCTTIQNCSDEDMKMPFKFAGSDKPYTFAEALAFHQSHTMYHTGQINYIQTLYGDSTDHWF
jgi:uncharacterized damage-inducible protein DinB